MEVRNKINTSKTNFLLVATMPQTTDFLNNGYGKLEMQDPSTNNLLTAHYDAVMPCACTCAQGRIHGPAWGAAARGGIEKYSLLLLKRPMPLQG
jgi:hypothetical protein